LLQAPQKEKKTKKWNGKMRNGNGRGHKEKAKEGGMGKG